MIMRIWREQVRRYPDKVENTKLFGLVPWTLACFIGFMLIIGFAGTGFAQDCTPEDIQDPENSECLPEGSAARGKLLFTGETTFATKGPACAACHNVSDSLSWGGGTLGPDLTQITGRLTEPGVLGVLQSLAFPTMAKVYETKQLKKQEQADLLAFFVDANSKKPASFSWIQFWWGLGIAIILLILSQIFWGKRFSGVRKKQIGGGSQ
jgi:hypothetical protein